MAHKDDYIPAKDADFNVYFKNIVDYVEERTGGHVRLLRGLTPIGDL
jgi:hypothetical protein